MKLRIRISKFSPFIHYVVGLFILKTKIEGMTTILLVSDFDHVTNKIFVVDENLVAVETYSWSHPRDGFEPLRQASCYVVFVCVL